MGGMSYDVSIGDFSQNYTSNVARLFYDHIPQQRSRGGLHELHGLTGSQAARVIVQAFERIHSTHLRDYRDFCSNYDPENGWGCTVGALIFLANIMGACVENPRKKVSVWA